jgi:hypothetical protein
MLYSQHWFQLRIMALLFCALVCPWSAAAQALQSGSTIANTAATDPKQTKEPSSASEKDDDEVRKRAIEDLQAQKDQATYALYLVVIGAVTAVLLIYQLILLRRQVAGARAEFNATHRPRIAVRQVSLKDAGGTTDQSMFGAEYVVANTGDTYARIIEVNARLWVTEANENLPAVPPYGRSVFKERCIAPGESGKFAHSECVGNIDQPRFRDLSLRIKINRHMTVSRSGMLFLGYVIYEDGNKIRRTTAFLREYRYDLQRFEPIRHPDYEFQD